MKYAILIPDGAADYPLRELGGKTPLEVAKIPNMTMLARDGQVGLVRTVPKGMPPASDIAIMSIFGYDPRKFYTGRGPLEAANIGISLGEDEVAFRCNLITAEGDILADYSAGHISTREAKILIELLNKELGSSLIKFYCGVSYRHLMVVKGREFLDAKCIPPHDIIGKSVSRHLPEGKSAETLLRLMNDSRSILTQHDINKVRVDLGENPANMLWLWGQGLKTKMPSFSERFGLTGSVISAVDLVKGIGKSIGLMAVTVPGATGYYDTNYENKASCAVKALLKNDFVFVHVEAPDEAGHNGDLREKLSAIEHFDRAIVGEIANHFKDRKNCRILILPDHPTPIAKRTHTADPVPFIICGKGIEKDSIHRFDEKVARESSLVFKKGHRLMEYLVGE